VIAVVVALGAQLEGKGKWRCTGIGRTNVGRWYSERNVRVRATRPDSHRSNDVAVSGYVEYHLDVLLSSEEPVFSAR
jgi:hypothetical protein